MRFQAFLSGITAVALLLIANISAANTADFRIPADDYRNIDCKQMSRLITTVVNLRQQGMSLEQAYEKVTPSDASTRVQLLHMIAISGFYEALGKHDISSSLDQLESICVDTGILQTVSMSTNVVCTSLDEVSPFVHMLQNKGVPLQKASGQVSKLMRFIPMPIPDSQKLLARKLPNLFENYVSTIYSQPKNSTSQTDFMQQCAVEVEPLSL